MPANGTFRSNRHLEVIVKGAANHRRIQALKLPQAEGELSLGEVAERLRINFRTASEHLRRLFAGGLIAKRYRGRTVLHALTPRGRHILAFLGRLD